MKSNILLKYSHISKNLGYLTPGRRFKKTTSSIKVAHLSVDSKGSGEHLSVVADEASQVQSDSASDNPPKAEIDTGLVALVMLARFHSVAADPEQLAHEYDESGQPSGIPQILLAAKRLGLKARKVRTEPSRLERTPLPAMAVDLESNFFILARVDTNSEKASGAEQPHAAYWSASSQSLSYQVAPYRRQTPQADRRSGNCLFHGADAFRVFRKFLSFRGESITRHSC